ncbi:hypothetical protein EHQ24_14320 [Leptospira noumeaensis]|uniref:Uncharacterized protein n=1 Tax=Leptospira noumeaensis TaxID=2484964 RepID=A0A4R9I8A7_9LEPT|nr:hypothetical protein EHQ24_14320 [Leptospira noumeaensis]
MKKNNLCPVDKGCKAMLVDNTSATSSNAIGMNSFTCISNLPFYCVEQLKLIVFHLTKYIY